MRQDLRGELLDIDAARGDSVVLQLLFGTLDLTGSVISAHVQRTDAPLFDVAVSGSTATLTLPAADTMTAPSSWGYSIVLTDAGGRVQTLVRGSIRVSS